MKILKESVQNCPIIKKGNYNYIVHPIADGIPEVKPELIKDVVNEIVKRVNLDDVDKIVTIEAMGLPIATALSLYTGIPFVVIRKRSYGFPDEIKVEQQTGYSKGELYINGLKSGDKVLIVDDIISTGGTLISVIKALEQKGVIISDIVCVIEKGDGKEKVKQETGYDVKTLIKVEVPEETYRIEVVDCYTTSLPDVYPIKGHRLHYVTICPACLSEDITICAVAYGVYEPILLESGYIDFDMYIEESEFEHIYCESCGYKTDQICCDEVIIIVDEDSKTIYIHKDLYSEMKNYGHSDEEIIEAILDVI